VVNSHHKSFFVEIMGASLLLLEEVQANKSKGSFSKLTKIQKWLEWTAEEKQIYKLKNDTRLLCETLKINENLIIVNFKKNATNKTCSNSLFFSKRMSPRNNVEILPDLLMFHLKIPVVEDIGKMATDDYNMHLILLVQLLDSVSIISFWCNSNHCEELGTMCCETLCIQEMYSVIFLAVPLDRSKHGWRFNFL
jgi:hypothetical protein